MSLNGGQDPDHKPTRSELAEGESSEDFDNFGLTANIYLGKNLVLGT